MADKNSNNTSASDVDYTDWPAKYCEDHPGFIYRYEAPAHILNEMKKSNFVKEKATANLWEISLRAIFPASLRTMVHSEKLRTRCSENHFAVIVESFWCRKVGGPLKEKHGKKKNGTGDEHDGEDDNQPGGMEDSSRQEHGRGYVLLIDPHRSILPEQIEGEPEHAWNVFERRFKETMMENRARVLKKSVHCVLSVGLKVKIYYFDATKADGDEGLITPLHEKPLHLDVVSEQVEIGRMLCRIKEQELGLDAVSCSYWRGEVEVLR